MITFEEYKLKAAELYNTLDATASALRTVTEDNIEATVKPSMGLVSSEVRNSAAFKDTKAAYLKAFDALRAFNGSVPPEYKRLNRKYK
tara:strand:- start:68 stop:331 length:264 start_codon:yes stop_codon:yes gene_type:complete